MATVIPTSEDDPVMAVVRFTAELAWDDAGPEVAEPHVSRLCIEAEDCIVMERWLDLASLILTSADLIYSRLTEKDLECIFTVICNLVTRTNSLDEVMEMAKLISTKIVQQPNDKPTLRLKILFNLYNFLDDPYSRFFVYKKAIDLAVSGNVTENIIPSFKKIDSFLNEWKVDPLDQRELFLAISRALKDNKSFSKDSLSFLTKYLATFSVEDTNAMVEAKEEAVRAITEFVKAPDVFQCDLLDLPAVSQLEKDSKHELVYQLLKIFLTQRLPAYLEFEAAHRTSLETYGLVHEECITKMRLMSLADLGSKSSGEIPYSRIRDSLQIAVEEVELWVVKAITAKVLDCKIDQMNQKVLVSRCTERVFGLAQWQALRTKLGLWRDNIGDVINTLQANKVADEVAVAGQDLWIR